MTSPARCDYLVAAEVNNGNGPAWVVVLALKRGKLHANQVAQQLQAGAAAAEQLVPQEEETRFRAAVFCDRKSRHERTVLRQDANRAKFHRRRPAIIRLKGATENCHPPAWPGLLIHANPLHSRAGNR
ncbi:MAG: hypothetical protein TE42_05760 [Candidatus Synechococcus spongiarum SP3]|uniref:Uncharacterized protein n=1 Tax=Candidatus Synechococcus spongiarum SP3 TaxID=1604020 RepID=A0A0G2HLT0_9SYNE|nr:MAG: hypothetical protein TE42_05760 [Candidatus Synechococcus spongiarum SP3]